ncbi:hypothetical protein DASC09_023050 [Saccharomycopsis crataegensis]|uniref:Uncharacterized protein n=1 Tax=Saccharomycopsis crataegensis TaxID=43959 RepID=A0AAV5QKE8_9ASCO|nr:hypothetical protein DASC09_023050 [Saccharomycopsis crataegensis]
MIDTVSFGICQPAPSSTFVGDLTHSSQPYLEHKEDHGSSEPSATFSLQETGAHRCKIHVEEEFIDFSYIDFSKFENGCYSDDEDFCLFIENELEEAIDSEESYSSRCSSSPEEQVQVQIQDDDQNDNDHEQDSPTPSCDMGSESGSEELDTKVSESSDDDFDMENVISDADDDTEEHEYAPCIYKVYNFSSLMDYQKDFQLHNQFRISRGCKPIVSECIETPFGYFQIDDGVRKFRQIR